MSTPEPRPPVELPKSGGPDHVPTSSRHHAAPGHTGPYWDALRKLARVRVGGPAVSGLIVSRRPQEEDPPSPTPNP